MMGVILKAFEDHYWDSLEPNKALVMLHVKSVLDMLQPVPEVTTAERLNGHGPEAPRTDYPPSTLTFGAN